VALARGLEHGLKGIPAFSQAVLLVAAYSAVLSGEGSLLRELDQDLTALPGSSKVLEVVSMLLSAAGMAMDGRGDEAVALAQSVLSRYEEWGDALGQCIAAFGIARFFPPTMRTGERLLARAGAVAEERGLEAITDLMAI
jgi:hypothetical protein